MQEYEQVLMDLDVGEGYRYEIGPDERAITERSRWVAVGRRHECNVIFKSRKDRVSGRTMIEVVKGQSLAGPGERRPS